MKSDDETRDERRGGAPDTTPPLGDAPDLLASGGERMKRDLMRARLFGDAIGPVRIGRFALLDRLGAGGMGTVYAAYDAELDRKVALKLLRSSREGAGGDTRMLREAQALAKLSHPNVVGVHEVGVEDGQVFIAMEFVAGRTLRAWREEAPRTPREVLDAYLQAGRGLAAAHEVDLVHRDFKPDNAMIGDDGRVRVLDFGLVRRVGAAGEAAPLEGQKPLDRAVTAAGAIMGTPAYMAPEQHEGASVDARADQYAFSVALYEALHGEMPFAGQTIEELVANARNNAVRAAPRGVSVPGWMRAAVVRGLRANPEERWPSMDALLDALERDPALTRRRTWRRAGVLVLAACALGALGYARREAGVACSGARARIDEVWGAPQREAVRGAMLASGRAHAAATLSRVEAGLDQHAAAWASMHTDACLAHRRGEVSGDLLDLRMTCLERRRAGLQALVKVLAERGNPAVIDRAIEAVDNLDPLETCADTARLRADVPLPKDAATAAEIERLGARLAAVKADSDAGLYARGYQAAAAIADEAAALGHAPIAAEALLARGELESQLGRFDAAVPSLEEAFSRALSARADAIAARAAIDLILVTASRQGKPEAAKPWERSADALVERLGDTGLLKAELLNNRGVARTERGEHELAEADHRSALAIFERIRGPRSRNVAVELHNIGVTLQKRGRYAERIEVARQALSILEESLGPDHPEVARMMDAMGIASLHQGDTEGALEILRKAVEIAQRGAGERHPITVAATMNLALAMDKDGDRDGAAALYRRAQAIVEADMPPNPLRLARILANLGAISIDAGRAAEGLAPIERALALQREALGPDHADVGKTLLNLGGACASLGRDAEAGEHALAALAIFEKKLPPGHPVIAQALVAIGRAALKHGDEGAAALPLERALAILAPGDGVRVERAEVRFLLAKALAARDRARALDLASAALTEYEQADFAYVGRAAEVAAWRTKLTRAR